MRISDGLYLIGSHSETLEVNQDNEVLLVEKALTLEEYLRTFGVIECLRLDKLMQQKNMTFVEVIQALLKKYKVRPAEIVEISDAVTLESQVQFKEIL